MMKKKKSMYKDMARKIKENKEKWKDARVVSSTRVK